MKKKLSDEEVQKALDGVKTGETSVEFASQDLTIALDPYIEKVLDAIGHPEAWVSDMSSIGDLRPDDCSYQEFVNDVAAKLGIGINKGDYIIDIAMRLKALDPPDA